MTRHRAGLLETKAEALLKGIQEPTDGEIEGNRGTEEMENGKAVVVDDSRSIRMILTRTLEELGWTVMQAPNGKEAINLLDAQPEPANLVLIDWNMPEMNGLELVRQIRGRNRFCDSKLMMVTTETEIEQMMAALEAGANEYVMKPFTKDVIQDKLRLLGLL